jgi:CHAT domain-containing protein/tetratricopeptide (TPR) repeat protein
MVSHDKAAITPGQALRASAAIASMMLILALGKPAGAQTTDLDAQKEAAQLEERAVKLHKEGQLKESIATAQKALTIREASPAKDDLSIADTLSMLGTLYYESGDLSQAAKALQRVITIRERALGPDALPTAEAVNDLAVVRLREGDFARAEPLLERVLEIRRKALGSSHIDVSASMNNLAEISLNRGDFVRAKSLLEGAVAILDPIAAKEAPPGPASRTLAAYLNNLGRAYMAQEDYTGAEAPLLRSLDLREKTLPPNHANIARALNTLGSMYHQRGDLDKAEPYYTRALGIYEANFGVENVQVAPVVSNLAVLNLLRGNFDRAGPLYLRALELRERNLGTRHPDVATSLAAIAVFYELTGDGSKAVDAQRRSMEIREQNAGAILATGSEEQKLQYADTLRESSNITLWMREQFSTNREALDLAVTTVLRRKGRVLDAMVDVSTNMRRTLDPAGQQLFDELSAARALLAKLAFQGPGKGPRDAHEAAMRTAGDDIQRLERLLSQKGAAASDETRSMTAADVQRLIPPAAQLVEFVSYQPFDPRATKTAERFGPARLAAFLLRREGEPRWVELGNEDKINTRIAAWRAALRTPSRTDVKALGRAVDDAVMRPLRQVVDPSTRHLIVSPDGSLNLIPFGALVDEENRYLLEQYEITYVTSGRDLLRLQFSERARQAPLVIADPAFDLAALAARPAAADAAPVRQIAGKFAPLPGTAAEAQALAKLMPRAEVETGANASEVAVKAAHGPSVLHIASHGFFFDQIPSPTIGSDSRGLGLSKQVAKTASPLLRSGLALAGANLGQGGGSEDGLLTAIEAASLDLMGTKLVVLSACETGVGEVRSGEGVQGLRRAFVMAGAESVAMSLWPVSDEATKDLMADYYEHLLKGQGRAASLRSVQLGMLKDSRRSHPFYWASFLVAGQWSAIEREQFD